MMLDELVEAYKVAEQDMKDAQEDLDTCKKAIVAYLQAAKQKTLIATAYERDWRVTVVERETIKFDEASLFKELGKRRFARVADLKLNKNLLEQAIASGEIDMDLVSACSVISKSDPFLRVTDATGDPDGN
jgi:hypothetical protein